MNAITPYNFELLPSLRTPESGLCLTEERLGGDMELDTALAVLLGWASQLSGYPVPEQAPHVRFEDHDFFVETVCRGRECGVVGWYNDAGVVFVDRRFERADDLIGESVLVHEFTHFLQQRSGAYSAGTCEQNMAREREAYRIQNRYIRAIDSAAAVIDLPSITCNYPNHAGASD